MNVFQILILLVLLGLLVATVLAALQRWLSRRLALVLGILWVGGAVVAIWPKVTTHAARFLGIGRGADLVLYCAVLAMLVGFFMVYVRIRRLRGQLTQLVREIAHLRAEGPLTGTDEPGAPEPDP